MAPIASDPAAAKLEVEAKRGDGSWHPCRLSLSDTALGIVLSFEDEKEQEMISTWEDALARLRIRSTYLQGGECSQIKEGDRVLAMYKGQSRRSSLDAVVETVHRVTHSKRVYCRCTFELKWLAPQLKNERITVPSQLIMKISDMDIKAHPVVAEFRTSYPSADAELLSISGLFETTSSQFGFDGLLEKQVEELSKYAAGLDLSEDNILGAKEATSDGYRKSQISTTSGLVMSTDLTGFKNFTEGKSKQLHMEGKDNPPTLLSPLAARAALASLIHELPKETGFPIYHIDKESPFSLDIPLKFDSLSNKNVSENRNPCENLSCERSDLTVTRRLTRSARSGERKKMPSIEQQQANGIVDGTVSSSSISSTSQNSSHEGSKKKKVGRGGIGRDKEDVLTFQKNKKPSDTSSSPQESAIASEEPGDGNLRKLSVLKHSTNSVVDSNTNGPTGSRRITRSAAQREMLSLCAELAPTVNGSATSPICTNPTVPSDRKAKNEGNTKKDNGPFNSEQDMMGAVTPENNKKFPDIPNTQTKLVPESTELHVKKLGGNSLSNDRPSEANSRVGALMATKRITRSAGQRERSSVGVEQQQDPSNFMSSPASLNSTARTNPKKARSEGKVKKDLRPVNLGKDFNDVGTPEKNEMKRTVSASSSIDASTDLMHGIKRTQSTCEFASTDGNEGQGTEGQPAKKKRMPAPNPVPRSSPRTRSQVKASQP